MEVRGRKHEEVKGNGNRGLKVLVTDSEPRKFTVMDKEFFLYSVAPQQNNP